MTLVEKPVARKGAKGGDAMQPSAPTMPQGQERPQAAPSAETQPAEVPPGGVPGLAAVELTPERIQLLGMKTARAERAALAPEIRTVGFVTAREQGLVKVDTRFAGWIEDLRVAQTGQKVSRGQVLASVYSPDLLAAQQELLNALRWSQESGTSGPHLDSSAMTRGLAEDARRRLELYGISRQEIDAVARSGKPLRALPIRSPATGHVVRKEAVEGAYVQPGTPLFELADLSDVWVLADLYEYEVDRVEVGQTARLTLQALPGKVFEGRVQFLYPTVEPETRTLRLRVEFPNPDLRLRPGMYGDVVVQIEPAEGLVVPAEAVVDTGERQYVFLAREGGRFEPRSVRVGMRAGDRVQVLEGLAEGDIAVTTANFLIDSESRLRAAIEGMGAGGAGAPKPAAGGGQGPSCDTEFDRQKYPDKHQQCRACEVQHRGMGTMEEDCKKAIPRPWR